MVYDLAKLMLSASLWDGALRFGVRVAISTTGNHPELDITLEQAPDGYLDLARGLPAVCARVPALRGLLEASPDWHARLAVSHATHMVAESACRLSDAAAIRPGLPRTTGDDEARAFFHIGLMLLDDALRRIESDDEFELADHLALLTADSTPEMKVGLRFANSGAFTHPTRAKALVRRAEEVGLESIWVSDHVLLPLRPKTPYPYSEDGVLPGHLVNLPLAEPLTWLTWAAAHTHHPASWDQHFGPPPKAGRARRETSSHT